MTILDAPHNRIHALAAGWAVTAALLIVFLACALIAFFWPTSALGQGWNALLAASPDGSFASLIATVVTLLILAWLMTGVFVGVYNCLLPRQRG